MSNKLSIFDLVLGKNIHPYQGEVNFEDPKHATKLFSPHYEEHIRPLVNKFEQKRIAALKQLHSNIIVAIPLFLLIIACAAWLLLKTETDMAFIFIGGSILIGILKVWCTAPVASYKHSVKSKIYPKIFNFFGNDYDYQEHSNKLTIESLKPSEIIPGYDEQSTEDYISGVYKDVPLQMIEAKLVTISRDSKGRTSRHTTFQGIFILMNAHKNFDGKTIVKRDSGKIGNWFGDKFNKLETVRLEDPEFEKMFQVYSSDQVEARYLLTTSFMDRLINLADVFGGKGIQCSFYDDKLLFMIPSKHNRFETGSIFEPATFENEINTILAEMEEIFQIIDVLKLNVKTGL